MTVRVVVADDNPVVRAGLRSLLELDATIEVCGEAESGPDALAVVRSERPDVVLLDVRMPNGGGLEVLAQIKDLARVLMLTYSDEPAVVSHALRTGATGYLVHGSFESSELAVAVKDTAVGNARLSPAAAAVLLGRSESGRAHDDGAPAALRPDGRAPEGRPGAPELDTAVLRRSGLSRREVEIARLLVRGLSNSEVAGTLFIEEKTVKNHINRLFAKLSVPSRPAAIAALLGIRDR
jgi:DNA-binding NarL/FixJ family response regulator